MKIIYVVTRMIIGGAQETAKYTAEYFHQRGNDVLLVTGAETGREGQLKLNLPTLVVPYLIRGINPPKDLKALWSLYNIFKKEKPDIVHSRTAKARFLTSVAARLAGVKVVVQTIHGYSFNNQIDRRRTIYILLEKLIACFYHCNVIVSETDQEEGYRLDILKPATTELIRSGVNIAKIREINLEAVARLRASYAPHGERIITLVGRLSMPKTPDVFVNAAALVLKKHPREKFLLVGDGPKREELADLIERLGLREQVYMLGLCSNVGEILAASDLVVHSSTHEGLPKTILEAMAAGKPVIGTKVGGVPFVIEDRVTGLLVDKSNAQQLAQAIEKLLNDGSLCEHLVSNAGQRLHEFSMNKTLEDTEKLYKKLLAAAG